MWASVPIVPMAMKAAKAREWPTSPMTRGAHQQPRKKPTKCAEPRRPICVVVKPSATPDSASSGAIPPTPSCRSATDRKRAEKERSSRMGDRKRAEKERSSRMGSPARVVPPVCPVAPGSASVCVTVPGGQPARSTRARMVRSMRSPTSPP